MGFPAHQPVTSLRPMGLSTGRVLPPVAPALDAVTECVEIVEIDNRYPSLTQTKHAYNQQCGRSTGARTRTEPAFWALLSARPADVADDGRHRSYLPIVNHESYMPLGPGTFV